MKRILLQLDSDPLPSSFDAVVAVDAGVQRLIPYGGVTPDNVTPLVHGAIFTRGPDDLKHTALFIGGSNVARGEALLAQVKQTFFGPMRVSVLCDPNGANTTAAAAVRAAAKHLDLPSTTALVLGGTGPVGQRAARILARHGAKVKLASRSKAKAEAACRTIHAALRAPSSNPLRESAPAATLEPCESTPAAIAAALPGVQLLLAAGAAGVQFLDADEWQEAPSLQVAIDLNAVPPLGLAGIEVTDKAKPRGRVTCYGAIAIGGVKMKIHKAALRRLFESNDQLLDVDEIDALACEL